MRILYLLILTFIFRMNFMAQISQPLVIDHTAANLDDIPQEYIEAVKTSGNILQYGHQSHGGQLTHGLGLHEDNNFFYNYDLGICALPEEENAFGIWIGMKKSEPGPDGYWNSQEGRELIASLFTEDMKMKPKE